MTFEICAPLSPTGKLIRISKDGALTVLGRVNSDSHAQGNKFVAVSSEECVIETMALIKDEVKKAAGKVVKRGK